MILGKRFSRLKRRYNAGTISVTFTRKDGTVMKPHRKLNMLLVFSTIGQVNKKAALKEIEKFNNKYKLS